MWTSPDDPGAEPLAWYIVAVRAVPFVIWSDMAALLMAKTVIVIRRLIFGCDNGGDEESAVKADIVDGRRCVVEESNKKEISRRSGQWSVKNRESETTAVLI
ncbi:hypothetical protein TSUD_106870 [Trifolium subterraneum]|uniref:Uncharacterized protein n=1 Tax=Trifolium subterraneum TaxID=3900 RepID=A0A2Z6MTW6_TRISU|nr:hypothetical protein TSUD_106870 [Trifolium subterraneum]